MIGSCRVTAGRPLPVTAKLALGGEIVAAYARARWSLRRRGLRDALDMLRSRAPGRHVAVAPDDRVAIGRRLGRTVRRTLGVLPADSRCLMCSLVLTRLLAQRGIESELVISVRPGESFAAHAWLEHEGAALLPPDAPASERLVTL